MNTDLNKTGPLLNDKERQCCADDPQDGKNGEESCLGSWKEERKAAINALMIASSKKKQAEGIYDNAIVWKKKLKILLENAQDAHEKSTLAYSELELFIKEVEVLERNTALTGAAIEALLCLIKRIFDNIFALIHERTDTEDTDLILKLMEYIRCLEKLDEQKRQKALECVVVYQSTVSLIYSLQEDVLNKVLEMLHCANILVYLIKNKENLGLNWQLDNLRKRLIQETTSAEKIRACLHVPDDQNEMPDLDPPCNKDILKPAYQLFPIRKMNNKEDSEYYRKLNELYEQAKSKTEKIKNNMQEAREEFNKAWARKNCLDEAIKAAEAAEVSK